MGIYVPNMEKPKDCRHCPRRIQYDAGWGIHDICLELSRGIQYKYNDRVVMQDDCPIIEIDNEEMDGLIQLFEICKKTSKVKTAKVRTEIIEMDGERRANDD